MNKDQGKQMGQPKTRNLPAPAGGVRMETFIPWTLVKRGAKKEVITPLDAPQAFQMQAKQAQSEAGADGETPLLRSLGLAHHWQRLLDERKVASVAEIAQVEEVDVTQVRRLLRLNLLSPQVIELLMQSSNARLDEVIRTRWPAGWVQQVEAAA
ncbi:hypothetical protein BN940_02986 [Castellaniella defragrans 65Phen]|uniref:Bacteriophage-related protein n=1 Tax=Castellaniella defragrans (strain DSM 12143 / CCUG 39792 / 65Phen) TaxID=1437824 RepID=W8WTQ9_CASD6|nr:hypothetical protein [Castellaniella defragrans]CDM23073.1 hypothetical protein BN940_02986 [Castellaniella defragrans 65Phen]